MAAFASTCYAGTSLGDQHSVPLLHGQLFFWSSISRDIIEIMPIAALMSANVEWSLGSNLNFTWNAPQGCQNDVASQSFGFIFSRALEHFIFGN